MRLDQTTAARLIDWTAFFSENLWLGQLGALPLEQQIEAVLSGPPAWVTKPATPDQRGNPGHFDAWAIEPLLLAAWGSGDADLMTLADHVEDLGADWMAH